MKNIVLVVLMVLAVQFLNAVGEEANPAFNGPNDCGGLNKPLLERILVNSNLEEQSKCGYEFELKLEDAKSQVKAPFSDDSEPGVCCQPSNEKSDRIRKFKVMK